MNKKETNRDQSWTNENFSQKNPKGGFSKLSWKAWDITTW